MLRIPVYNPLPLLLPFLWTRGDVMELWFVPHIMRAFGFLLLSVLLFRPHSASLGSAYFRGVWLDWGQSVINSFLSAWSCDCGFIALIGFQSTSGPILFAQFFFESLTYETLIAYLNKCNKDNLSIDRESPTHSCQL